MEILFDIKLSSNLNVEYYSKNPIKKAIHYALMILSFGLYNFYFSKYNYFFYDKCTIENASHIKIENIKRNEEIEFIKLNRKKIRFVPNEEKKFLIYFFYKYHLYYFSNEERSFIMIRNKILKYINMNPEKIGILKKGLDEDVSRELLEIYGRNLIEVPKVNVFKMFVKEILAPVTLYQFFCVIVWHFNDYELYGQIVLFLTLTSIVAFIYQIYNQNRKMREMAYHEEIVEVKRSNKFIKISSLDLSIGDIIKIKAKTSMPCDVILLKGKCIMKEAMLTGETEPIIKSIFTKNQKVQKNNLIFAGTESLLSKYKDTEAIGIVVNTGFYTFKGELVRSLLLGETEEFQFNRDVFLFLLFMVIITLFGFLFYVTYEIKYGTEEFTVFRILIRGAEFFATAVPPTLPLSLTIGLEFAVGRLKNFGIHTLIMGKINEAGRIKIMCFDKTGTLTQNELIFRGFVITSKDNYFGILKSGIKEIKKINQRNRKLIEIMGCCHSLSHLEDNIVGDPLEIEMFQNSRFLMFEDEKGRNYYTPNDSLSKIFSEENLKYTLLKKIDFTPERKRFSCLIKDEINKKYFIFSKGAPVVMKELCDSLPEDFDEKLKLYSQEGYRILAVGYKEIKEEDLEVEDNLLESNLNFVGLICFRNPLKSVTRDTIADLQEAGIKNIMITGDNLLTALHVAFSCNIITKKSNIWEGHLKKDNLVWQKVINEIERKSRLKSHDHVVIHVDEEKEKEISQDQYTLNMVLKDCENRNSKIILTGNAFEYLYKKNKLIDFDHVLTHTLVYGRSNPHQKALIVKCYKKLLKKDKKEQYFVGFCGDGANDCPALKSANVGLSLSDLEAAIAAPFTSTVTDISNVPNLIKEGKASLMTGLQNFKYIICSALFQFYGMLFNFVIGIDFSSGQYYLLDLITFFPITIIMCLTDSNSNMVNQYPFSNLVNSEILVSIIGCNLLMIFGYLILNLLIWNKEEFLPINNMNVDFTHYTQDYYFFFPNYFNFLLQQFVIITIGIAFNKGFPFRKDWYNNKLFLLHFVFMLFFMLCLFFLTSQNSYYFTYWINVFIRKLDYSYKDIIFLVCYSSLFCIGMYYYETIYTKKICRYLKKKNGKSKNELMEEFFAA